MTTNNKKTVVPKIVDSLPLQENHILDH